MKEKLILTEPESIVLESMRVGKTFKQIAKENGWEYHIGAATAVRMRQHGWLTFIGKTISTGHYTFHLSSTDYIVGDAKLAHKQRYVLHEERRASATFVETACTFTVQQRFYICGHLKAGVPVDKVARQMCMEPHEFVEKLQQEARQWDMDDWDEVEPLLSIVKELLYA